MNGAPRYSWTQPVCVGCWNEKNPGRQATNAATLVLMRTETCCYCGEPATSGIYVRVDPSTVPFPEADDDE